MPRMMLSPDRLNDLLAPQGFSLWWANAVTKEILFVRPSGFSRLYEHLIVCGQGKQGEAVYATTALSASVVQFQDSCIAEEDHALLYTLQTDTERHWSVLRNGAQAREWEVRLAAHTDSHCRATTASKGRLLFARLQPAFDVVDQYIEWLGDVTGMFDSEFRYFSLATKEQRTETDRLAFGIADHRESVDDTRLACLALVQFAAEIEGRSDHLLGRKVHEEPGLRTRIYLLADYLQRRRKAWLTG